MFRNIGLSLAVLAGLMIVPDAQAASHRRWRWGTSCGVTAPTCEAKHYAPRCRPPSTYLNDAGWKVNNPRGF